MELLTSNPFFSEPVVSYKSGLRIYTVVWIFYWVYGAALVYLATVSILQSEAGISLPLNSVTTVTNLLPYVSLGLVWMVILNIYRILKKPSQNREAEA